MNIFEKQEMQKTRPQVKSKINEWYDWLVSHVPQKIKGKINDAFEAFKIKISGLYSVKDSLKDSIENEARKEHLDLPESEVEDLTPQLHEHAFKKAFKSFKIPGLKKTDVDVYIEKVKPHLKTLIEEQLKELGSVKVQLHMWIKWFKREKIAFHLDEEDMGEDMEEDIKNDQPRKKRKKRKKRKNIPHPEDMDIFEKQEMQKTRPQVKSKINEWYDWLVNHVPQKIKGKINDAFEAFKIKISGLYSVKDSLKDSIENEARKEHEDLTPPESEIGIKNDHPKFYYIFVEKPFNSKMTEIYQGDDVEEVLENMIAHVKTQVENPALEKSGFKIDHIMHLNIDFHQLNLTRGSSYIELPSWIEKKKAVINPKNIKDEECFKWAVIAALHHEEIDSHPERISKLKTLCR